MENYFNFHYIQIFIFFSKIKSIENSFFNVQIRKQDDCKKNSI
jgi:hypothetical protein